MSNKMRLQLYLSRMHALDSELCVTVSHTNQYRLIRDWFRLISRLGDGVFWYGLMLAIIVTQQADGIKPVLHMLAAGLTGTLIYKWLKQKTHRPRPFQVRQDVWVVGKPLDHFSFPSGHTLHAVAFSMVAMHYYPPLAIILVPFMLMVAMSRVILGLHYPSDVLAGASIGYLIAQLYLML
ncbi:MULTISPECIES: phosphatase PAP2 family protein [Methylotenera]|uniref:phosphatase PAP2 family protein n=1 Tax=Methylotenera TaxID=359407 RepID=UPI000365E3B9|nr:MULTISPECIES: phosphatase PAP2 family protein [Methylotenera]